MQGDMRDFLNTPSGLMRPGTGASSHELEPPPTPLGGRTVILACGLLVNSCVLHLLRLPSAVWRRSDKCYEIWLY
jgi:hypothetical protein